jgi:hypothetical protein
MLKRMILLLAVAALMSVIMVFSASPTFAVGLCDREPGLCNPPKDPPPPPPPPPGGGEEIELDIGVGDIFRTPGPEGPEGGVDDVGDVVVSYATSDGEGFGHDLIAAMAPPGESECPSPEWCFDDAVDDAD